MIAVEWVITAGALLTAVGGFVALAWRLFRWIDHQKEQDVRVDKLEQRHRDDQEATQTEQTLIVYGLLACLKGLREKGCNGPVTEAIDKIEKHINQKAHGQL